MLTVKDGVVVTVTTVIHPNLKGIIGQQVGDAIMDHMMEGANVGV